MLDFDFINFLFFHFPLFLSGGKGFGAPYGFDNTYYKELLKRPWLSTEIKMAAMIGLPSDHVLPDSPVLLPMIEVRNKRIKEKCAGSVILPTSIQEKEAHWR